MPRRASIAFAFVRLSSARSYAPAAISCSALRSSCCASFNWVRWPASGKPSSRRWASLSDTWRSRLRSSAGGCLPASAANSEPVVEAPTIAPSDRIARPFHLIGSPVDDVGQHAGGMVSGIDPVVGPSDLSVLVDQKAHASWPRRLGILAGAVRECDRSIVAEEGKLKVILLREPGVRFHAVKAHAENLDI